MLSDTQIAFVLLTLCLALQRLWEARISKRNAKRLLETEGAREHGRRHLPLMIGLHAAFLIAAPLEVVVLDRAFLPQLAVSMLGVFLIAQALRAWAILSLGRRWTIRVIVVPGLPAVTHGPYRYLRHPNYVAVLLELIAFPLIHTAYLTAVVFVVAKIMLLALRISVEDKALRNAGAYSR